MKAKFMCSKAMLQQLDDGSIQGKRPSVDRKKIRYERSRIREIHLLVASELKRMSCELASDIYRCSRCNRC